MVHADLGLYACCMSPLQVEYLETVCGGQSGNVVVEIISGGMLGGG